VNFVRVLIGWWVCGFLFGRRVLGVEVGVWVVLVRVILLSPIHWQSQGNYVRTIIFGA